MLERYVFGTDQETMESAVLDMLRSRGLTLAVSESLTGGLAGARLAATANSSDVFRGGLTSESADVRSELVGAASGPQITAEAAKAMALGVRKLFRADIGLAATGVAGPDEQEDQLPGTVYLGLAMNGDADAQEIKLPGDPNRVRQYAVISLLNYLRLKLLGDR